MKKLTIWMITSTWILYVLVPIVYKHIFGRYPRNIESLGYIPEDYMTKAAIIISAVFAVCVLLIFLLPVKEKKIVGKVTCGSWYYYIAISLYVILAIKAGVLDYNSVITRGVNSSFFSYYSMFFYPQVLVLIFLFGDRDNGRLMPLVVSYFVLTLIMHSRSGAVQLGIYIIGFSIASGLFSINPKRVESNIRKYRGEISIIVITLAIAAPIIFVYSTQLRGAIISNETNKSIETIAARCSCLDEAGLALYLNDTNGLDKEIFMEKYGILNQIKSIIDSTIPGSIFGMDTDPNQYYRAAVGYMSVKDAETYYSSVNLMLPTYMILKYGLIGGILLSVVVITAVYLFISQIHNPIWQIVLLTIVFAEILYYFDWVMIWKSFLRCALTIFVFEIISHHVYIRVFHSRTQQVKIKFKILR